MVTLLSAMLAGFSYPAAGPGPGLAEQAAASGLGVGQAEQLVADEVVREAEGPLEILEVAASERTR